jgi:hypothetical protein
MPVPLSVMQAAAQGDKKAMRLVEQEYGIGNGQNYAIDYLSEEEPPPRVPTGVKGIEHPTRYEGRYHYPWEGKKQVKEGEAKALAEKLSRLKKKSDMQDVLLKVAAEDAELAEQTARTLMSSGMALTAGAAAAGGFGVVGGDTALGSAMGIIHSPVGGITGYKISEAMKPYPAWYKKDSSPERKEYHARERMQSIELSPEAQTIYDEYKAKGYSPTYYKTK